MPIGGTVTFMASGGDCEHEWGAEELALTESAAVDVCLCAGRWPLTRMPEKHATGPAARLWPQE